MPNHCENWVEITGPNDDIDAFVKAVITGEDNVGDGVIDLTSQYPMPEELRNSSFTIYADVEANAEAIVRQQEQQARNVAEYGHKDWYDWALANWGTKWGDYDHYNDERYVDSHKIGYMTAWGPFSNNFWQVVSAKWATLTFSVTYDEPGMGFLGGAKYANGEVLYERHIDNVYDIIGELDWEDDEARDEWMDKKSNLLGSLTEV